MHYITEKAKLKELQKVNNMNISIQRADIQNLDAINSIELELEHRILSYDTLSYSLKQDMYYFFVAKKDDVILGYIVAQLLVDHFDLLAIAVSKEFRRQNIATLLLNKLFSTCKELNISNIFLEVRCNNLSAINFYIKNEFKKISERKNYYKDTNEDAYIYMKEV